MNIKEMKKYIAIVLFFVSVHSYGQQIGVTSAFNETKHYWNPAFTGESQRFNLQAFGRQQWLSFEGAPRTGFVGIDLPLVFNNMALGGFIGYDNAGPLQRISLQVNYAYSIKGLLWENSALTIGLSGSGTQFSFNPNGEVYNDEGDALISSSASSTFFPAVNSGLKFTNNTEEYDGTSFYIAFAYKQLFSSKAILGNADLEREKHIFGSIGIKMYGEYGYFEPSLNFAHVEPQLLDIQLTGKYEFRDLFWAGVGYSSLSQAMVQGGYILPNFNGGSLRFGVLGNFNIGILGEDVGPGFEFLIGYSYDLE